VSTVIGKISFAQGVAKKGSADPDDHPPLGGIHLLLERGGRGGTNTTYFEIRSALDIITYSANSFELKCYRFAFIIGGYLPIGAVVAYRLCFVRNRYRAVVTAGNLNGVYVAYGTIVFRIYRAPEYVNEDAASKSGFWQRNRRAAVFHRCTNQLSSI
jgi:hypothetical protein